MAYQFADTFDHYSDPATIYESVGGSLVLSSSYARFAQIGSFPNQGIHIPGTGTSFVTKNLKSNQAALVCFMSFGAESLPIVGEGSIMVFFDNGTEQCYLGLTSTGALQFYVGNPGFGVTALGPPSAAALIAPASQPNHGIEVQITFSASSAIANCWLDGSLVISATGLNNIRTANAYANQVGIGSFGGRGYSQSGQGIYCDYFRIWDATGTTQNAPVMYDCRKVTKLPTGPGALTGWTANGAAANWQCVNENPPDGDTTYVSSSSTNSDSYAMGSSGLIGIPSQVVAKSLVRKDDAATRTLQVGVRSAGVNGLAPAVTVSSTFGFIDACIAVDPATGNPPLSGAADSYQHLKFEAS
jgi:hypothetical protein